MDMIYQKFFLIAFLIIICYLIYKLVKPSFDRLEHSSTINKPIGNIGEHWVKQELDKLQSDYLILNNVMIRTANGITHQIDQ